MIIDLKDLAAYIAPEPRRTLGRPLDARFRAQVTFAVGAILDELGSIRIVGVIAHSRALLKGI
jgi:hypothetical protein